MDGKSFLHDRRLQLGWLGNGSTARNDAATAVARTELLAMPPTPGA